MSDKVNEEMSNMENDILGQSHWHIYKLNNGFGKRGKIGDKNKVMFEKFIEIEETVQLIDVDINGGKNIPNQFVITAKGMNITYKGTSAENTIK